jgi:hypothetical protein
MRHRTLLLPYALVLAASLPAAYAGQPQTPKPGDVASLTQLPDDIRVVIGPDVSDRGGPFAAGCVAINGEPHSRFVGARMSADKAEVTIERGGIAHYVDTLDFRQVNGRWVHVPKQPLQASAVPAPGQ